MRADVPTRPVTPRVTPPVLRPLTRARATVFAGPDVDVPPRRRAVLAIFAMAIGSFAIGTSEFVTMGLLPDIADGLGVSIPQGGYLISAYAVGVVLGAPVIAAANVLTAVAPGPVGVTAARLLAGLPHGAYFGVASLLAACLVLPERRGQAVSSVMLGLAAANVVGVPAATWLGQAVGWRSAYWTVSAIAVLCVLAMAMLVPSAPGSSEASVRRELSALRRPQVWLTVLVGMIGFGGMFSMYSYIAPLITDVTGMSVGSIPLVLLAFGVGGVLGTVAGGRAADGALVPSLVASLSLMVLLLAGLTVLAHTAIGITVGVFVIAFNGSVLVTCLQMRLVDVAGEARTLGAALNHASLNAANALGAWLGGRRPHGVGAVGATHRQPT